ncbi:hypothetical protein GCM10007160_30750 [Litchfieldella qijiaojingensis]|uniref:Uncharacterized protein n=1 Tax=Litchfieldella qijiaojingensis TaxID=980347 RepID=A0ABQ2Z407_9GAMM|nr:hypothetical protein GCM10007160_30750 [Halomonas qijiaojingensis]
MGEHGAFRGIRIATLQLFGTATLSFADGIQTRDGDRFEVELPALGRPLRNPVRFEPKGNATPWQVRSL